MARDVAIVLSSGGLKSAVTTALALQKYRIVLLNFEAAPEPGSGRRTIYEQQIQHFKPFREYTIAIPWAAALGQQGPGEARASGPTLSEMGSMLGIAARFAEQHSAAVVYAGMAVGSDSEGLPRATEFFQIWNELIQLPVGQPEIEVTAPLLELERWQIVDLGMQVNTPFEKTWSCERNGSQPCWECPGCRAREAAFQQAGKADPMRPTRR